MPQTSTESWLDTLRDMLEAHQHSGAFVIGLPHYRSDLAQMIADSLGVQLFDYRAEVMAGFGWGVRVPLLDDLDSALNERAEKDAVVAAGVDSLIATKSDDNRLAWLDKFLATPYENPVIVPLCVFDEALLADKDRTCFVGEDRLPPEPAHLGLGLDVPQPNA